MPFPEEPLGPGIAWLDAAQEGIEKLWKVFPPTGRRARHICLNELVGAIERICRATNCCAEAAFEKILAAARVYASSAEGMSKYCKSLHVWLRDGHYEDDPRAWNREAEAKKHDVLRKLEEMM